MIPPYHFPPAPAAISLGLAALGLFAGCQHAPPPAVGKSSFAFVPPPPEPPATARRAVDVKPLAPQEFVAARPILPLAAPVYPATALAAHAGAATVSVRLTIDPEGRVADIAQSFVGVTLPGPFERDFRAAVDAAVSRWRFSPACIRYLETVTDQGYSYPRVARQENVTVTADVIFTFTAAGGVSLKSTSSPSTP